MAKILKIIILIVVIKDRLTKIWRHNIDAAVACVKIYSNTVARNGIAMKQNVYNIFMNAHLHFTMRNNNSLLLNQSDIFRRWQIWFSTSGQSLNDGCPPAVASFLTDFHH